MEEGILPGAGGSALLLANAKVTLALSGDEAIGADIVKRALKAPLKQIAENAGFDAGVVVNNVLTSAKENYGFNAATGEYVDMFDAAYRDWETDRKSTRLNSSHRSLSRMPSSA